MKALREQEPARLLSLWLIPALLAIAHLGIQASAANAGGTKWVGAKAKGAAEKPARSVAAHTDRVMAVEFSPSGDTLATCGWDGTVKLWDVRTLSLKRVLSLPGADINDLAFAPNGKFLVAACRLSHPPKYDSGQVVVWKLSTGQVLRSLRIPDHGIWRVAVSPDSKEIASSGSDTTQLWSAESLALRLSLRGSKDDDFYGVSFSPDGTLVATASEDFSGYGNLKIWNRITGAMLRQLSDNTVMGVSLAFSPDGKFLASGGSKAWKYWDVRTGKLRRTCVGLMGDVTAVAFSPDGKMVATGSGENKPSGKGELKLWDTHTGKLIKVFHGHQNGVNAVAFSPVSPLLASGSDDQTAKLWAFDLPIPHPRSTSLSKADRR